MILKQQGGWTYGILANQIWSFADAGGPNDRPEINQLFLQPFLAYTWKDSTTLTLNTESYHYWETGEWSVPLNLQLSHIYNFGKQPVSLAIDGMRKPPKTALIGASAPWPRSYSPRGG